jgi:2-C-methyl-D-erythritol 4-phosphate cytidylyltransferase
MGIKTRAVNGDANNIKLTTPEDLLVAEAILKQRGEIT